jgi:hypothetical protein
MTDLPLLGFSRPLPLSLLLHAFSPTTSHDEQPNQTMPFRQAQGPELADGQRAPKAFASRLAGRHEKEEVRFMKDETEATRRPPVTDSP